MAGTLFSKSLLVLGCVWASQAGYEALDECSLYQKGTHLMPDVVESAPKDADKGSVPMTMLVGQRRKKVMTMAQAEFDKVMNSDNTGSLAGVDKDLNPMDPAKLMEMLPSLMDALRDDNFIRSFIQFEDGVERASLRVARSSHAHLDKFLRYRGSNSSVVLVEENSMMSMRMGFARFLDTWVHQVLASYTEELTEYAELFRSQVGGEHMLSKEFADIFVPFFKNVTAKLNQKMIVSTRSDDTDAMATFEDVYNNDTEGRFCKLANAMVYNATKSGSEAAKVLKMLNATRKMAVPMLGKFMDETLPQDADVNDKEVPQRMMLVVDYEVGAIYAGLNALRDIMGEYGEGLSPLIESMGCTDENAATGLFGGFPRLVAFLVLAFAARFGF